MTLLPGLIDAHVHMLPNNNESTHLLKHMAECGVTIALDVGHLPAAVRNAFRRQVGLADLRFAGSFALRAGARTAGWANFPKPISATARASRAVRAGENRRGRRLYKMVADIPGPTRDPERLGH